MKHVHPCICITKGCNNITENTTYAYCLDCVKNALDEGNCGNKGGPHVILKQGTDFNKLRKRQRKGHKINFQSLV